jgi:Fe-Mn family superoxide dismutase
LHVHHVLCFALRLAGTPCGQQRVARGIMRQVLQIQREYRPLHITLRKEIMTEHRLPALPYPMDALEPHISAETLEYHHGKHHASYVKKLNGLIPGTEFASASLEDIIRNASGGIFNNGAQVWNHTFYWNCLRPAGGEEPERALAKAIDEAFGSFSEFKERFTESAATNFGSGWTWLVKQPDGSLAIVNTSNAGNPMTDGSQPLLTCDVWEHAYYIDYRNARNKYLDAFWNLVNWDFVARKLGES